MVIPFFPISFPQPTCMKKTVTLKKFRTESGFRFDEIQICYHTFGERNPDDSNVVWICHALTADSDPTGWWPGLVGKGCPINPERHFIICANILGSCYGTTNPLSVNPATGKNWFFDFPLVTVRDMVKAHILLADELKIKQIGMLAGGSMGGQQVLEWAITEPERIKKAFVIATNALHSPWGIAFNESQRLALESDPSFRQARNDGGKQGLKAARSIALLSYRNYRTYGVTQRETEPDKTDDFRAASYQRHQGDKLVKRFDAYSYYYLTKAMDSHNVGRGRGSVENALKKITAKTAVVSISGDLLFPPDEQKFLHENIPRSVYHVIDSLYGHDGFLLEYEKIKSILEKELIIP